MLLPRLGYLSSYLIVTMACSDGMVLSAMAVSLISRRRIQGYV